MDSDYPFGIFKLFHFKVLDLFIIVDQVVTETGGISVLFK